MKLETLFDKFDHFADGPNSLAKIRELVLELAVQGRLTSTLPSDGVVPSAIDLREDAAALADTLGLRSPKEAIEDVEPPYDVPSHWRWIALADIGAAQTGTTPSKNDRSAFNGDIPFIKPADILPNSIDYSNESLTRHGAENGSRIAPKDSLLMVCIGTIGKCNLIERECAFNQQINSLTPVAAVDSRYLLIAARSRSFLAAAREKSSSTTIAILNKGKWLSIPVPIPPLAEQKRIVARVDELMALCGRLEAQQQERDQLGCTLTRASLARFAKAPTPANLDFLFHPSYAIAPADLRRSILTLAVQGKLVTQDPNDEPAEKMIRGVSDALPNKRSQNPFLSELEAVIEDESEYELPFGWAWLPLGHVGIWATGCGFPTQYQGESDKEFLFCKVSDMNLPGNEVDVHTTVHTIDADVMKKIRARANPAGTVIFPKIGGAIATHKRRLVIKPTIIDNNCSGIQPIGLTDNRWLLLLMRSLDLTKYQSGTSMPAVSQSSLNPIRIGVPPLAEQRRIVAKVDELMALVDALETQLAASCITGANLVSAAVAELTNGKGLHAVAEA